MARQQAAQEQGMRCKFCYTPLTFKNLTGDHFYPKSKGGSNEAHNIVAACKDCNNLKSDMLPQKFKMLIRNPPIGVSRSTEYLMARYRLRISLSAMRACQRIKAAAK